MKVINPPKALILLAALICLTVLMSLDKITADQGLPLIAAIFGYGIGNGVSASGKNKHNAIPMLGRDQQTN
jgi:hypothetical protein